MVVALIALFVALGGTGYAARGVILSSPSKAQIIKIVKGVAPTLNVKGAAGLTPLPSGKSESGLFAGGTGTSNADIGLSITYPRPLSAAIVDSNIIDNEGDGTTSAHCSGPGHADPGYLCLYNYDVNAVAFFTTYSDEGTIFPAGLGKYGVVLYWSSSGNDYPYVGGSWTVTAP